MRVLSGVMFFPRGGSAHVTRALSRGLRDLGHEVTVVSGSVGEGLGDARRFYRGLDVRPVRFGRDAPMHPSYEARDDAPDPVFGLVDDAAYETHVEAWSEALERAGAADADVLHLHHLTPLHEAAARVAPGVPVVGHLHGTELLFLEQAERWPHGEAWAARMREWAQGCDRLLVLARTQVERAERLLGIDPEACSLLPNGFDPRAFGPGAIDRDAHWREHLGRAPQGPVLTTVSRFTAVKRLPLLVRAWAAADLPEDSALVLVGGYPGEVEGEHPADVVRATGARGVHLPGWFDHDDLPPFFRASDAVVLASVREQFGQVLVEGMACGLPAIAVDAHGPAEIVVDGVTGWLVPPDDQDALSQALSAAAHDAAEREARGAAAREDVLERFAWPSLAERLAAVLAEAVAVRSG
jgi:glycosyltransferase involved in cell wall biosynthesis